MKNFSICLLTLIASLGWICPPELSAQDTCSVSIEVNWNCFGNNTGWAVVTDVTDAMNPTSILWSTGETVQFVTGLPNGEHWVMVTDANGCWDKEYITVSCASECMIDFELDHGCEGEGMGWASLDEITGALGTTSILWSTGETTPSISNLASGEYWAMVTDLEGCWHKEYFYMGCPNGDCNVGFTVDQACEGEGMGWASVEGITGTTGTLSILWSTDETTGTITGLSGGDYWVMVTDAEGCWRKEYFSITCPPADCEVELVMDQGCLGGDNGWAVVEMVTGAAYPVSILWSSGATVQFVTGLPNGEHWVMVTDANGCWDKEYFTVGCPGDCDLMFDLEYGCGGSYTGWAAVENITGATGITTILWSTGADDQYLEEITNGDHWVLVTDEIGCWEKQYFSLNCEGDEMPCALRTQTMGGWGAPANGNNPGVYRDAHFDAAFPNGLTIGCTNTLVLTSAEAVKDFLPSGGQPQQLPAGTLVDPNYNNTLSGQLVALTLSVGFDANDPDFGSGGLLADAVINNGLFEGWTVQQLLDEANSFIGGCGSSYTASQLNDALSMVSENFVDGDTNEGNVDCAPGFGMRSMMNSDPLFEVRTFPVPATSELNIEISSDSDGTLSLIMRDAIGRSVLEHGNEGFVAGEQRTLVLDVNSLRNGSYLLTVMRNGLIVSTERIMITR